jgi:pimeloyl-ACP methyl ester carboxylesterase
MIRFPKIAIPSLIFLAASLYWILPSWSGSSIRPHTQLIRLNTEDGLWLNSLLREPVPEATQVAVLMIHGYGGNFYSGIMGFLPEALTSRGFTTLALNTRDHDRGPKKNLFEENRCDIAAGVDELARRGFKLVFLYGHSMGTNRVLYYLAETMDPRIRGVILTAPPGNLFQWNIRIFGREKATGVLQRAQLLVANGKGDEWMLIDLGPLGKTLYTANHVVSLRGPDTRSDPFQNIARISAPVLIVHGLADRLAEPAVADQLRKSAGSGNNVKVVKFSGANHRFKDYEKPLANSISQWLKDQVNR